MHVYNGVTSGVYSVIYSPSITKTVLGLYTQC